MLVSRCAFLMILGFESGCLWDWKTMHLASDVLWKSTFAEVGFLMIPGFIFHVFGWPWDKFLWLLLPWRLVWNLMTFQGELGSHLDLGTFLVGGKLGGSRALVTIIPGSLQPTLEILIWRLSWEYIGFMVHWKRGNTWCFAAWRPPPGGPADLIEVSLVDYKIDVTKLRELSFFLMLRVHDRFNPILTSIFPLDRKPVTHFHNSCFQLYTHDVSQKCESESLKTILICTNTPMPSPMSHGTSK